MTIEDGEKKGGLSLFAKHAVQFYIVGASGVLVNLGILYLLTDIGGFWYVAAQVIAITASITTNFFFNRYWTFGSHVKELKDIIRNTIRTKRKKTKMSSSGWIEPIVINAFYDDEARLHPDLKLIHSLKKAQLDNS